MCIHIHLHIYIYHVKLRSFEYTHKHHYEEKIYNTCPVLIGFRNCHQHCSDGDRELTESGQKHMVGILVLTQKYHALYITMPCHDDVSQPWL